MYLNTTVKIPDKKGKIITKKKGGLRARVPSHPFYGWGRLFGEKISGGDMTRVNHIAPLFWIIYFPTAPFYWHNALYNGFIFAHFYSHHILTFYGGCIIINI